MTKFGLGLTFITIMLFMLARQGSATQSYQPAPSELKLLPPFCAAKYAGKGPQYERWKAILGPGFIDVHHYCAGLRFINRYYQSMSPRDKKFNLQNALNNLDYMINSHRRFTLLWEVYLNRGRVHSLGGHYGQAIDDLKKAATLNPHSPNVYLEMADVYISVKARDKALTAVTEGIRQVPQSGSLKRRYDELGGKKPYPDPYVHPNVSGEGKSVSTPGSNPTELSEPSSQSSHINSRKENATSGAQRSMSNSPSNPIPEEGGERNRWCRFCPPAEIAR